ncbi:MAG TPA: HD domain-containing protein, partial [Candidatus Kapabacteria bacterium]
VRNAIEIAAAMELSEKELALLLIAAWFHDAGIPTVYHGHEKESCAILRRHFEDALTKGELNLTQGAILSTEIPQHARNTFEQILCDADLLYLGGNDFFRWSDQLREEHGAVLDRYYSNLEWIDHNLHFVERHRYYTPYAREQLASGLEWNITLLRERRERMAGN